MNKKRNNHKKKIKFIRGMLFLFVLWIVIYVPIKLKYFTLIRNEVKAEERFNEILESIQYFKDIKISYNNLYGDGEKLSEIEALIDNIENKLINNETNEIEDLVLELKSKVNNLSALNERELEEYFNSITEGSIKNFNDEEANEVNRLINEYNNLFSEKNYKLGKEKLDELDQYINETKKIANKRKINETYEERSSEDTSLREPKYIGAILIVNKEFGLPDTFAMGESNEAREAFEKMKADASKDGIYLNAFSTYRSYWTQERLYSNYVANYGEDPTDTFSAKAGFSEHQTGLAFDIGGVDRSLWAEEDFKYTAEAEWLKNNCTKYGFILRYPEGKEWVTGYMYESWHFRYIGVDDSKNFENNDITLEEYLGI